MTILIRCFYCDDFLREVGSGEPRTVSHNGYCQRCQSEMMRLDNDEEISKASRKVKV